MLLVFDRPATKSVKVSCCWGMDKIHTLRADLYTRDEVAKTGRTKMHVTPFVEAAHS